MNARLTALVVRPHQEMVTRYLALWGRYELLGLPTASLAEHIAWHERKIEEAIGRALPRERGE